MRVRPRLVVQTSHTSLVGQRRARGASDGARGPPAASRVFGDAPGRRAHGAPRDARAVGRPSGARTRAARGSSSRMSRGVPSSRRDARSRARPRVEHRAARPLARRAASPNAARRLARRRGPARDAQLLAPRARSSLPLRRRRRSGHPGAPLRARDPAAAAAPPPSASPPARRGALARVVGSVGIITLACKLLGLLREVRVAAAFGVGPIADAHALACVVPTFFFVAVGGLNGPLHGVLTAVFARQSDEAECASREGERGAFAPPEGLDASEQKTSSDDRAGTLRGAASASAAAPGRRHRRDAACAFAAALTSRRSPTRSSHSPRRASTRPRASAPRRSSE